MATIRFVPHRPTVYGYYNGQIVPFYSQTYPVHPYNPFRPFDYGYYGW